MSQRSKIPRRGALNVGGLTLVEGALPGGLVACAGAQAGAAAPVKVDAADGRDPRLRALAHAVLAPSSHNTQPWLLDLSAPECVDLYIDTRRALPRADPLRRQLLVSHGTFVETASIAFGRHGHEARIEAFPNGSEAALRGRAPVARLRVVGERAARPDPLFDAIFTRHTNKRVYEEGRTLGARELETIADWSRVAGCELRFVVDARQRARLATLCRDAMAIDVSDRERNEETAAWFRFDDDELAEKADGFGLAQGGVGGFNKWMAETFFLSRSGAAEPDGAFAKKSVELTWEQASSASAFGLLTTRGNERTAQLAAGRSYVRAQLAAEALGVRTQPFSQLLQEYPAMIAPRKKLAAELGIPDDTTVQMLFRLGFAEPTAHSPRRPLAALLIHPKVGA